MKFRSWVQGQDETVTGRLDADVAEVTCDSREAAEGWAFVALRGEVRDGADYVPAALAKGACAILADRDLDVAVPFARLGHGRATMAQLARRLYREPDQALALIGVTGTNGKTTTTTLIRQLLRGSGLGCGLVNVDDPYGRRLLEAGGLLSYGLEHPADYRVTDLTLSPTGTQFRLTTPSGAWNVRSPLLGRFNVYNLLAALAALNEAGFDLERMLAALPGITGAPGRLDRVDCGQPFGVLVDYAHTPDALEKLLTEGKRLLPPGGRLHVLFGCGVGRDHSKRPIMARTVAEGADVIWHTSDNTRYEEPERIMDDVAQGIPEALLRDPARYHRITDRALAVAAAIADCRPGDLLLLAGKGHEPYQDVMGVKHPYSDRAAVEAALQGRLIPRPWAADAAR